MSHIMFQTVVNEDQPLKEWTEVYITSIFKVIRSQLEKGIENKIHDEEIGLTARKFCIDNTLYRNNQNRKSSKTALGFTSFKKAYKSVPRTEMGEAMQE